MTSLRQHMTEDLRLRNLSPRTQATYLLQVSVFARHFHQPPELLGPEALRTYQLYLVNEKKLAPNSVRLAVAALRFLYQITLHKDWSFRELFPPAARPRKLPVLLSPEEVSRFLECVAGLKHRAILTTCYAAGLRISEVLHLQVTDIDSRRMTIRVEQGKGGKDRYVMLLPRLLETLRQYWRVVQPRQWLFPGDVPGQPLTQDAVQHACLKARIRSGILKPLTPHSLRHAFAVHLLESGTDIRTIQLLLGHRGLATTAKYLRIATSQVCSTTSPLDRLPGPAAAPCPAAAPVHC